MIRRSCWMLILMLVFLPLGAQEVPADPAATGEVLTAGTDLPEGETADDPAVLLPDTGEMPAAINGEPEENPLPETPELPGTPTAVQEETPAEAVPAEPVLPGPAVPAEPEAYTYDFFVERLSALEERASGDLPLTGEERAEILLLRDALWETEYTDLLNEASFLLFLAQEDLDRSDREANREARLEELVLQEQEYQAWIRKGERIVKWKKNTLRGSVAGAVLFGLFRMIGDEAYDQYIQSATIDEAWEHQKVWQFADGMSAVSLGYSLSNLIAWAVLSTAEVRYRETGPE